MSGRKRGQPNYTSVLESEKSQCKVPKLYAVYLLNDDYTPMDFVVEVLVRFFFMTPEVATQIMLQVHHQGKGLCGVFSRDVAETKVVQVNEYSRRNQHPLMCNMELV